MLDYLVHHGTKGMRWGIRRYQNPDGSLTEAGKARIKKIYSKVEVDEDDNVERKLIERQGVRRLNDNTDIIQKGTRLGRFSNTNKEKLLNSTYVYLTRDDEDAYENMATEGTLGFKEIPEHVFKYDMSAVKDLKVVSGEKVVKDVMEQYGDSKIKDIYALYQETRAKDKMGFTYRSLNKLRGREKWAAERMREAQHKISSFFENTVYKDAKIRSEIVDKYSKLGYDAMVDAEDYFTGFEYPLIILDPKKSLKVNSIT